MRTNAEILARIKEVQDRDFFGTECNELVRGLDFNGAADFLKPEVTAEQWGESMLSTELMIKGAMQEYMGFAIDKAINHRGLSASRSISHFMGWLWLLGDDELVAFCEDGDNYANYGMPCLKRISDKYAFAFPTTEEALRMATGQPCEVGCSQGCGR